MRRRHHPKLSELPDRSPYHPNGAKVSKNRIARLAKEGYQKMARKNVLDTEAYLAAMSEILQQVAPSLEFGPHQDYRRHLLPLQYSLTELQPKT